MYDVTRDVVYLTTSMALTAIAAWKLYGAGRKVLIDAFHGNAEVAGPLNQLLVGSFCLLMGGYLAMTANFFQSYANLGDIVGYDMAHFGGFLMFLGFALWLHLFVMTRIRGRERHPDSGDSIPA